jgi:hypothetical protein
MGAAIRIVLNPLHATLDPILIAFEVNDAIVLFVTTSLMSGGYAPVVVTTAGLRLLFHQPGHGARRAGGHV